ncbi:RHS repeat protein [Moritella sp. 24]|uniref:RHS repeat protein n=1 Tax=Moritella sp. 24 TaxID=2746230 RepID=UPI001BADA7EC|nr:RHS repeat protein [Moritella sp. 24]QUM76792.1 RHS repeat protein [Moritella sp. 24]
MEFSLGTLLANNLSGPNFEKKIYYNPFDTNDYGYGIGWKLYITHFDKSNYNLTLKNGQRFRIQYDSDLEEYVIPYKKLQDTKVYYMSNISKPGESARSGLKIAYKNGETEFVDWSSGTLQRRVSPHGQEIYFDYAAHSGSYRLICVSDSVGNELNTDYWTTNAYTKVSLISITGEERHITLYKMGSKLDRVTLPNTEDLLTRINYETLYSLNVKVINTVIHPTGQVDYIWYKELGHKTPSGSPMSHYPYVTKFQSIYENGQPSQTIIYDYSTLNFLGYNSGVSWDKDEDTLFKALSDYTYSSDEIINGDVKITRHYNKYHLVDKEQFYDGEFCYQVVDYAYFANLNWKISDQPANYSLAREQKVTFYSSSGERTETNTYDYDIYGNILANFYEDGSVSYYEYYPLEGVEAQCPEAPYGIVRFLKSENFHLPGASLGGTPYRSKHVEYKEITMLNNDGIFVVPIKQINHNSEVAMIYYEDKADNNMFGRIESKSTTVNGSTSHISHRYLFDTSYLSITNTLRTHDGYTTLKREDFSYLTGNMMYALDEQGISVSTEHDDLDRVISESWAHNNSVKISRNYDYTIGDGENQLAISDSTGRNKIFKFSNANNLISIYQQNNEATLFKSNEFIYDAQGQIIQQSSFDRINSIAKPMHEYREYDHWGEISKVTYPDDTVEIFQNDVVAMQSNHYIEGLTRTVTTYNIVGKELSILKYDPDDIEFSETINDYNSAHQLIKTVDENDLETFYQYDDNERLIEQYFYDDDVKIKIDIHYASFTNDLLTTQVSVNNTPMGQRAYDGLGRVTTESKFEGTAINFDYTGSSSKATSVETESGSTIEITYEPFWGEKTAVIVDGDENNTSTYQYDNQGRLIRETNSNCAITYVYNNLEQLVSESVNITEEDKELTASYTYSPMGVLLQQTDFVGMSKVVTYDSLCRIERTDFVSKSGIGHNSIVINYDAYSRPTEYTYSNGYDSFINTIYYNSFGVESGRKTHKGGELEVDLSIRYLNNLKIDNRQITITGKRNTNEDMGYDQIGRLTQYNATGELTPRDNIGQLTNQAFNFDIYDNIDSKLTTYSTASEAISTDYQYHAFNKTQLSNISTQHIDYPITHDSAGNLTNDELGNQYEYDVFNRLKSIRDSNGNSINSYQYDARGFLISQRPFNSDTIYLYYQFNSIANECSSIHSTSYIGVDDNVIGRVVDEVTYQYMATDTNGSVLSTWTRSQDQLKQSVNTYTPFGSGYTKEFSS